MTDRKRAILVEFIGAFALIFIGAGSIVANTVTKGALGVTGIALAHGLTIAVMVSAAGHISGGHFNPAVTLGFLATRRISVAVALMYIGAQLIGAVVAGYTLKFIVPHEIAVASNLGATTLDPQIGVAAGILIEAILTFFLVFVIFGTAVHPQGPRGIAGLAIGLTITLDILMGGPWTGASMNPARTLGPAAATSLWENHFVYWIGPLVGGTAAAVLYHYVLIKGETKR